MRIGLEDWDFLIGFLNKEDIVYRIPKVLFLYRVKLASKTTSQVEANKEELAWQILNNHPDIYRNYLYSKMSGITKERYNSTEKLDMIVGHAMTKPVRLIRKLIHKFK